jgi:predicted metal-dependent enzyme (double-stranded beta helix superfamily)
MEMIHPELPALCSFVEQVSVAIGEADHEGDIAAQVLEHLVHTLERGLELDSRFCSPVSSGYVMYPLFIDAAGAFSVASAVWNVGQETPIHDHGVWGVVGIVSGVEHEVRYVQGHGRLVASSTTDFGPGQATVCCTETSDMHQVACGSSEPCVGIHVYGGDIGRRWRHRFDKNTGASEPFISRWPWVSPP